MPYENEEFSMVRYNYLRRKSRWHKKTGGLTVSEALELEALEIALSQADEIVLRAA